MLVTHYTEIQHIAEKKKIISVLSKVKSSASNYPSICLESPMYEYQLEACETLILLKFIDISDFLMLHFGAMNLLLFLEE